MLPVPKDASDFSRKQQLPIRLAFLKWKNSEQYHIGVVKRGSFFSPCRMILIDAVYESLTDEAYDLLWEQPEDRYCCPVCAAGVSKMSKGHFGGQKLKFKRALGSKTAPKLLEREYF